jgi:hypothetical protein
LVTKHNNTNSVSVICHLGEIREKDDINFIMAILRVYKRNPTFIDVANLVEEISKVGLGDGMQK